MKKEGKIVWLIVSIVLLSATVACVVSQYLNKRKFLEVDSFEE